MNRFFTYLNLFPMPLWLAMMFAPHHPLTERLGRSSTVFGLGALHYIIAILIALKQGSQERRQAGQTEPLDLTSLNGIRNLLSTRSGTLAAWAHMLALDLFTGGWIYRQSRRIEAPAWVRIGSLLFTLMMGPFGLLLFLLWRMWGSKAEDALE
ncbi:MAG: DUF4281 domain-containing protein [Anaerolineae bacterium]|nr:DUF4281 domain-containing protein [Anaerolineae bacterium]